MIPIADTVDAFYGFNPEMSAFAVTDKLVNFFVHFMEKDGADPSMSITAMVIWAMYIADKNPELAKEIVETSELNNSIAFRKYASDMEEIITKYLVKAHG